MSWFRSNSATPKIPEVGQPAPSGTSSGEARRRLLGSEGRSTAGSSGQYSDDQPPPPYNPPTRHAERAANAFRQEQEKLRDTEVEVGRRALPTIGRNTANIADPYRDDPNAADRARAALFSGYDRTAHGGQNRFTETGAGGHAGVGAHGAGGRFGGNRYEDDSYTPQSAQDEEEDVEGIKQQTRFIKQESVNSTRNALRIARETEETARSTLSKIGEQSEKLANTERHIDHGKINAARADDKTDELKALNRSIFRPNFNINKDKKRALQEAKVAARYEEERMDREKAMYDVRETHDRLGRAMAGSSRHDSYEDEEDEGILGQGRAQLRNDERQRQRTQQRSRYQFEKTASDDELEDELDDNLDAIGAATKNLRNIALAAGEEIDRQNKRIDTIANKTGKLNMNVDITTNRLKRVK